jgi:MFS family permease
MSQNTENPYRYQPSEAAALVAPAGTDEFSSLALAAMTFLAALAMVGTLPGRTQGLGLITEPMLAELSISKTDFATLNLVATLIGAAFCWPCGWLLDKLGLRVTSFAVLLLLGISTLGIGMTRSAGMLWIWVTLTRGFGQSMLSVVSITLIGKSSVGRRQPIAMAGFSFLVSLFFIVAFVVMGKIIPAEAWGWRASWQALGWIVGGSSILFLVGVLEPPKGETSLIEKTGAKKEGISSATLWQALASPAFWIFAATSSLYGLVSSGLSLFNQSVLAERHFNAEVFYSLLSVTTMSGMLSNLACGVLARWISYGKLMAASMTLYAVSLLAFPYVGQLWQVYVYGISMGICGGIVTVVFFGVWSQAFGRDHLGQIQGIAQLSTVVASAVGPLVFAACQSHFGSYTPAFWTIAPVVACLALLSWILPTPSAARGDWAPRSPEPY